MLSEARGHGQPEDEWKDTSNKNGHSIITTSNSAYPLAISDSLSAFNLSHNLKALSLSKDWALFVKITYV